MKRDILEAIGCVIVALFFLTNVLLVYVIQRGDKDSNRADAALRASEKIGGVAFVMLLLLMLYYSGYCLYKWIFL